jgi:hypothetical protein
MKRWWLTKLANQIQYNELEELIFFWKNLIKIWIFGELWPLQKAENLPIIKKTKHPTKGKKKVQDGKTQVLANEESSKEGEPLREQEQIMKLPPHPKSWEA